MREKKGRQWLGSPPRYSWAMGGAGGCPQRPTQVVPLCPSRILLAAPQSETWAGGRMVHQRHQNMHKSLPFSVIASTLWNASRARLTSVQEKAIKEKEKWLRKILPMISWGQGGVGVWKNIFWNTGNNSSITQNRYLYPRCQWRFSKKNQLLKISF